MIDSLTFSSGLLPVRKSELMDHEEAYFWMIGDFPKSLRLLLNSPVLLLDTGRMEE